MTFTSQLQSLQAMLKKVQKIGLETIASKSAIKQIRASLQRWSKFPQNQIEIIFPKKASVAIHKMKAGQDHKIEHIVVDKDFHFIYVYDYCVPILKTIHSYPDIYPRFIADQGALRFILNGAHVMAAGLVNQQAHTEEVEEGAVVNVYVYGIQHCVAVGIARKSSKDIRWAKGVAVEVIHYIGDAFWKLLYKC